MVDKMQKTIPLHRPIISFLSLLLALSLSLSFGSLILAESSEESDAAAETGYSVKDIPHVYDEAELLTEAERTNLEADLRTFIEKYGEEVIFVSTRDTKGKSTRDFAADFYDESYPEEDASGAIILLDMQHRELNIVCTGNMMSVVTDYDMETLYDAGWDSLLAEDYYAMNQDILAQMGTLLDRGVVAGHSFREESPEKAENTLSIMDVIISLIASLGVGGSYVARNKSSYKAKTRPLSYSVVNNSIIHFARPIDELINSTVKIIPVATSNSSSKPYNPRTTTTTFKGSSGRTHSGGKGRKF